MIALVANESQGSQSIARSGRETPQPAPQADGSTAPVASESQGSQSIARSGRETSKSAPEPDRSIAPVANEPQGSQSIAQSGETLQPEPQADSSTTPVAEVSPKEANRSPKADGKRRNPRRSRTGRLHPWRMSRTKEANQSPEAGDVATRATGRQRDVARGGESGHGNRLSGQNRKRRRTRRPSPPPSPAKPRPSVPRSGPLRPRRRWRARLLWCAAEDAKSPSDAKLSRETYGRQDRRDRAQCSGRDAAPTPASWCVRRSRRLQSRHTRQGDRSRRPGTRQSNGACLGHPDWRAQAIGGPSRPPLNRAIGRFSSPSQNRGGGSRGGRRRAAQRQHTPRRSTARRSAFVRPR